VAGIIDMNEHAKTNDHTQTLVRMHAFFGGPDWRRGGKLRT
jgi:hypothetical protein